MPNFSAPINQAGDALRAGNRELAWQQLHPALSYPAGVEMSDAEFAQSLGMLALIAGDSLSEAASNALAAARTSPTDVQALFDAGFQLLHAGKSLAAATALGRANALAPDIAVLVNTLAAALEANGMHFDAYLALQAAYGSRKQNWLSRYRYVFNAVMSGNMVDARQGFAELAEPEEPNESAPEMHDRLGAFFERHRQIAPTSMLNEQDLRGWHYVVTGGLLTHVSPHGFDAGMNGRYAFVQDTDELIHEGILRALAVLQAWDLRPQQLLFSNDRSSEILANVWHRRVGIPIRAFAGDASAPGLFLCYDLVEAQPDFLQAVDVHRADQLLVSHASCWTQEAPFVSDICTFQYEANIAPWGAGRMQMIPGTTEVERTEADLTTPAPDIARRIADATVDAQALTDLAELTTLATTAGPPQRSGLRDRYYIGSPVRSSRFS